jgi:hypothetical protein
LAIVLLLASVLAAAPARPDDLTEIQRLADRGRTEQALRRLEDLLVRDPSLIEGQLLRGVLLFDLGETAKAERAFSILSSQYPDRPEPAHNLAVLQAARGQRATAINTLRRLVREYPDYKMAARNMETIRDAPPDGEFDPLSPEASRLPLLLTRELSDFAVTTTPSTAAAAVPPTAEATPPAAVPTEPEPAGVVAETIVDPEPEAADPRPEAFTRPPEPEPVAAARPQPATPAAETVTGTAAAAAPAADRRTELAAVVEAWAAAWSEQRVKEYLAFYAADFEPTSHASRQAWEASRRQRVAAPAFIEVEVDFESMTVRDTGPGEVSVTFVQGYRSDRFSDTVKKTLDMVREAGAWRIRSENSS